MPKNSNKKEPVHPGKILIKDFLEPMNLSQNRLALSIGVHPRRINQIVHGERSVTADTALRLGKFFDVSPEFWLNIQARYDLEIVKKEKFDQIEKEVRTLDEIKQSKNRTTE